MLSDRNFHIKHRPIGNFDFKKAQFNIKILQIIANISNFSAKEIAENFITNISVHKWEICLKSGKLGWFFSEKIYFVEK
jgi:hypothetical protein